MHVGAYERTQAATVQVQLGDVVAKLTCNCDGIIIWNLFRRDKVGQLALFRQQTESMPVWVVGNVWLIEPVRGRGLMRQLITILRGRYHNLCSDFSGETSEDAIKMWVALGAEKLFTARCPKGYVYLLR